ncbi:helicase associated domain-containing protein [Streptomyces sp. NPDC013313]|uniref:helicase associated domain-containing protein n=1 Tax=Streptomyces sp. NPDC013313 TaxID=3155603 RepID=UPI0033FBF650
MDWQRTYAAIAGLIASGARLEEIVPGVAADGVDVGRWLQRQRQHVVWHGLKTGQRERLSSLGVTPLPPETAETPGKASRGGSAAFERGCTALAQYKARTGATGPISRTHVEVLPDGTEVKLGVFCRTPRPGGRSWVRSSFSGSPTSDWTGRSRRCPSLRSDGCARRITAGGTVGAPVGCVGGVVPARSR